MKKIKISAKDILAFVEKNKNIIIPIVLFLIIALGFFLRFYNIENTPPGVYPDEAVNGEDAWRAVETGNYQWFYPANQGREGLFMNIIAILFKFFGASILTLKLPSIIFSTLTILGVYLLSKELFKRRDLALIAAFLTAVAFWSINFGRISFRANMLPFVLTFSFYFILRALRTKKITDGAIGGLFFGLGMHTYIAFRISPLILLFLLIAFILSRKDFLKNYWKHFVAFSLAALIIAAPMFYTFYAHPEYFESRSDSISIFSPQMNNGNVTATSIKSFVLSLIKYNFVGDQNWRHNYPPYPILDPLTSLAFLIGIIYAIRPFFQLFRQRISQKTRNIELEKYTLLIFWFLIMLAPEFLTAEGLPHALRSIGNLPAVFIIAAMPFAFFIDKYKEKPLNTKKIAYSLLIVALLAIGIFNSVKYHYFWANKVKTAHSFNKNITDISKFMRTLPVNEEKYIITSYNTLERLPIKIFHMEPQNTYLFPNELEKINPADKNNFLIIFTERNSDVIKTLQAKFPNLIFEEKIDPRGEEFFDFFVLKQPWQ